MLNENQASVAVLWGTLTVHARASTLGLIVAMQLRENSDQPLEREGG